MKLIFPFESRIRMYSFKITEKSTIFGFNWSGFPIPSVIANKNGTLVKIIDSFGFWNSLEIIENYDLLIISFNLIIKYIVIIITHIIVKVAPINVLYKYFSL